MRELEARNSVGRKNLMQALLENLGEKGVKADLTFEPAINCLGENVREPVIHLKDQNLNTIRLAGIESDGCGFPGEMLRFQYTVNPKKGLTPDQMKDMNAYTSVIKEGKFLNYFGGKVIGIKWDGQKLADTLNQDKAISADLMRCVKSWSYLEFQVETLSPEEVAILGPRFSNPGGIAALYHSKNKEEIQCCAFGYDMVDRIAGHINAA